MEATPSNVKSIHSETDVVLLRQAVRSQTADMKFSLVDQTKIVTAVSEIARNALIYGGGGQLTIEAVFDGVRKGLRLTIEDKGRGIADLDRALQDGFTTGTGMGLGLGGAKRLMDEFEVHSDIGRGTKVTMTKWKFR